MSKPKVIVTRRWPESVQRKLAERFDAQLNQDDRPLSTAELQDALRRADAVLPTVSDRVNAEVLSVESPRAKILGSYGVGFNHIDLEAAKAKGLVVTNTPEVLTDATADLAITLLLMVTRRAGEGERHVRSKALDRLATYPYDGHSSQWQNLRVDRYGSDRQSGSQTRPAGVWHEDSVPRSLSSNTGTA